ncbi:MAG: gamma-glutamylcyclotransferase, partial [Alphaproteobacteria bacterium]
MSDIWVFAYGSLMWNPGFVHVETRPGTLHG